MEAEAKVLAVQLPRNPLLRDVTFWLARRHLHQRLLLCLIGGMLSAFAFAPFYLVFLLCLSYPLLMMCFHQATTQKQAFLYGWGFGFGQFFIGLLWIANAFYFQDDVPAWGGVVAVAGLSALLAVYPGLVGVGFRLFFRRRPTERQVVAAVLVFVGMWSFAEWLRGHLFTGFPWNLNGYVFGFSDALLQVTSLVGVYGLGAVVLILAFLPYLMFHFGLKTIKGGLCLALFLGGLGGLYAYGAWRLPDQTDFIKDVKLRLVQPNINQWDKWDPEKRADNFLDYLNMSRRKPEEGITHVIWPETAVIYFLDQEPSRRYLIADMLGDEGMVLTGFPRRELGRDGVSIWNSFIAIDHNGQIAGLYDKSHLVPFGEYIPDFFHLLFSLLGVEEALGGLEYSPGPGRVTQHMPGLPPFGVLICYEIIFPGAVIDEKDRPDWLLNLTNDAWYGDRTGPYQHFLQTRVRAIEEGIPIIRSAGTGISAVIDSYGQVVGQIDLNRRGVLDQYLPRKISGGTLYTHVRDVIFFIMVGSCLIGGIVLCAGRRGRRDNT